MFIRNRWKQNWTQEAEAVSLISCSSHGKAFLDGLLLQGKHVCECNMCYGGCNCSQLLPDCSHICWKLNAITEGKYIIFGAGATHLLNAAVHALSSNAASSPAKVVASIPYYPVKLNTTVPYITSLNDTSNSTFIELVTSPNNPDGHTKKAVLSFKTIHDLAYYWPHFRPILTPADEDLMIFTLSRLTGDAGSRLG
ncbi:Tryptophan aminotransferase-related protein 4 [Glycine soja]